MTLRVLEKDTRNHFNTYLKLHTTHIHLCKRKWNDCKTQRLNPSYDEKATAMKAQQCSCLNRPEKFQH